MQAVGCTVVYYHHRGVGAVVANLGRAQGVELYVVYRAATNQREKQRREYEVVYCLHNVNVGGDKATKIYRSIPSRKVKNRNP